MKKHPYLFIALILLTFQSWVGCTKILDINPETGDELAVKKFEDFQEVLNSVKFTSNNFAMAEMLTDDIAISKFWLDVIANNFSYKNAYQFDLNFWTTSDIDELYKGLYNNIAQTNLVINHLPLLRDIDPQDVEKQVAMAKIHRAYFYLQLVGIYGPAYRAETAATDRAVPLVSKLDPSQMPARATVQELYDFVEQDLRFALDSDALANHGADLLHPGRIAAMALFANFHLRKGEYEQAKKYADQVLAIQSDLLNYEEKLDAKLSVPEMLIALNDHPEIILAKVAEDELYISKITASFRLSKELRNLFEEGDLRVTMFFRKQQNEYQYAPRTRSGLTILRFRNSVTVAEMMLVSAECAARKGDVVSALELINKLRESRFKKANYVPLQTSDPVEVKRLVLEERRRELAFGAGNRLIDLKRLWYADGYPEKIGRWDDQGNLIKEVRTDSPMLNIPLTPKVLNLNPNL